MLCQERGIDSGGHSGRKGRLMPIPRFHPGQVAPVSSTYALVGHYGEATNVALWLDAGAQLPFITVAGEYGPFWYVRVDVAHEDARAA